MNWEEVLRQKVRGIHGEIGALDHFLRAQAELPPGAEALFTGHYELLEDLYLRQIPFAKAAGCDLLLSYRPVAGVATPAQADLSAVDRLFGNVRAQIGAVTRAVLETEDQEETGELAVSAYAPGHFVGFVLPQTNDAALRQSLHHLGAAAKALPERDPWAALSREIDDPEVRDAALGALKKLFPYRDASVEALELRGRALPLPAETAARIDRETWETAGRLMELTAQPTRDTQEARFTGDLLQIDYELHRFELRNIDGAPVRSLRCAYPPELAVQCEGLAKQRVEVRGAVSLRQGRPRLLHVASIQAV